MNIRQSKSEFLRVIKNQAVTIKDTNGKLNNKVLSDNSYSTAYVDGRYLPQLDEKYKVVLDPSLRKEFNEIKLAVCGINFNGEQKEIGFSMVAEEQPSGIIYVSEIKTITTGYRGISRNEADIDDVVNSMLKVQRKPGHKPILILGHTHPTQPSLPNDFSNSWSLGDLYAAFTASDRYKNDLQTMHFLITPSLDTNFMFYDRDFEQFFRFKKGIFEYDQDTRQLIEHPAYSDPKKPPKKINLQNLEF
jgi:hypothetical protein